MWTKFSYPRIQAYRSTPPVSDRSVGPVGPVDSDNFKFNLSSRPDVKLGGSVCRLHGAVQGGSDPAPWAQFCPSLRGGKPPVDSDNFKFNRGPVATRRMGAPVKSKRLSAINHSSRQAAVEPVQVLRKARGYHRGAQAAPPAGDDESVYFSDVG